MIPVHIGDFKYPRTKVRVWCEKHIPCWIKGLRPKDGIEISILLKDGEDGGIVFKKGTLFGMELCKGTIRPSDKWVHPNLGGCAPLKWFIKVKK
jgi:hypothetical protein